MRYQTCPVAIISAPSMNSRMKAIDTEPTSPAKHRAPFSEIEYAEYEHANADYINH